MGQLPHYCDFFGCLLCSQTLQRPSCLLVLGPCDQQSFLNSASTVKPLDASLAGFSDVSTYRHWVAVDWSNIAAIGIGDKDLKSLVLALYVSKKASAVGPEGRAVNG